MILLFHLTHVEVYETFVYIFQKLTVGLTNIRIHLQQGSNDIYIISNLRDWLTVMYFNNSVNVSIFSVSMKQRSNYY